MKNKITIKILGFVVIKGNRIVPAMEPSRKNVWVECRVSGPNDYVSDSHTIVNLSRKCWKPVEWTDNVDWKIGDRPDGTKICKKHKDIEDDLPHGVTPHDLFEAVIKELKNIGENK